jgi:estrogen-related receptor beta like 1
MGRSLTPRVADSVQFKLLTDIFSWLMEQCGAKFSIDKFDDPNTSVNKMMLGLKNIGFQMDFPATKLKQAQGDAVCSVLSFLANKALEGVCVLP